MGQVRQPAAPRSRRAATLLIAALATAAACAPQALSQRSTTITARRPAAFAQAARITAPQPKLTLPLRDGSVRFAAIGDSGTGDSEQYEVGRQMWNYHRLFPFEFVIMTGDNLYGSERPRDYERKFEIPYKPLLDAGVKFYASLGNHDDRAQRFYKLFNMNGQTYYTFKEGDVRFFALESDYMDRRQLEWLEKELKSSNDEWKICFFHHPLYSSGGRHGSDVALREVLEPLFLQHGVDVVFAGHEHFYERLRPQKGIHYFTTGGAGKLRRGNIREGAITAKGFDADYHFMLIEIAGDELHFQTVSRAGNTVDSGVIRQGGPSPTAGRP